MDGKIILHETADVEVYLRAQVYGNIGNIRHVITEASVILDIGAGVYLVDTHAVNLHLLNGRVYLHDSVDLVVLVEEHGRRTDAYLLDVQRVNIRAVNVIGEYMLLTRRIEPHLLLCRLRVPPFLETFVRETGEHKAVTGHVIRQVAYVINPVSVKLSLVGTTNKVNLDNTGINLCLDCIAHFLAFRKKSCS